MNAPPAPRVRLHQPALEPALFQRLLRNVRAVGQERLKKTYETTFWFDFRKQAPSCVAEEAALALVPYLPDLSKVRGVEWWLSRMYATDVRVDFHRDRDERLALAGGPERHPRYSSVLFLNRVRGGALAVTDASPNEDNPSLAPDTDDLDLVAPRPNRFVHFPGKLTHGVLDANNAIPDRKLSGPARLRLTVIFNWWDRRPFELPTYDEAGVYRALASRPRSRPT